MFTCPYGPLVTYDWQWLADYTTCLSRKVKPYPKICRIMHGLPWKTFLGSRMRRLANGFHEWRSHEWKLLENRITSDLKSLFTVTNVLFYFHMLFLSWTHNAIKNKKHFERANLRHAWFKEQSTQAWNSVSYCFLCPYPENLMNVHPSSIPWCSQQTWTQTI